MIGDGRICSTGTPDTAARNKAELFPNEGGPAILEVAVPSWIIAILYAEPIAAGLARERRNPVRARKWFRSTPD